MLFVLIAATGTTLSGILNNLDLLAQQLGAQADSAASNIELIAQIKSAISNWTLFSTLLICSLLMLFATPFTVQHYRTLGEIRNTNIRLNNQAATLRATHRTIDNMLEDIIYEKKRTSRTSEINARLAAIINSAEDAIFSLNMAGYITTANEAALRVFGENCEGKLFLNLFPSSAGAKLKTLLMTTAEQNAGSTLDISIEKKKQRIDLSLTISPIHSDQQEIIGFSVIAKDISNTKLEEERFRMAVEAAPNAMIMVNQEGNIVLINSEAESMFGYAKEELVGQSISQLVPPSLRSLHHLYMQNYFEAPDRRDMGRGSNDLQGQRKDGELFPIEVGLTPITVDKENYIISSIIDISERLQQQRALKNLNVELRRKNQEMEQFIYAVSHDLKAPLVTIAGFANRLKNAEDLQLHDDHRHKLDRILANVRSMESLLQDLLHLSRIIKRDLEKAPVDTNATLQHVLDSLEGDIKKSGAVIQVEGTLPQLYAQESLLFQCIQNVISNALKYCKPDVSPVITISAASETGHSGVCIRDNGIGIAEHHQERIFHVFERLNPESAEGSGVGLSIVKTIMEKHSGKIILESTVGQGTSFIMLFPDLKGLP
ncbi:MAG TPA: PAS domain S-box protein [Cellvibrio sp.]|nr:PAS domain S-box protein [Cellvibrio sp.]